MVALDGGEHRLDYDAQSQGIAHIRRALQLLPNHLARQLVLVLDAVGEVDLEGAVALLLDGSLQLLHLLHRVVVGDARSELRLQGQLEQVRFEDFKGQVLQLSLHFHDAHLLFVRITMSDQTVDQLVKGEGD